MAFRFLVSLTLASLCALSAFAQDKKILFLAGPKDHGAPGRHEYERDLRKLAESLEASTNVKGVKTEVHVGRAPRDLAFYRDVAAIVIESSSDRHEREIHPLFPPDPTTNHRGYDEETTAFLKALDELIAANRIGITVLHYANWAENWAARGYYMKWLGGLWVQMVSRNPVDQWTMTPETPGHPILSGVKSWTYRDEMFCRFHLPTDKRRTNLLLATGAEDKQSIGPQIASWAFQRDDGGRGFVYGGVDWHENLALDDYRRFLLNGIAWTAHLDIPAAGIQSPVPDASGMTPRPIPRVQPGAPDAAAAPKGTP